jgi:hypothetical protein
MSEAGAEQGAGEVAFGGRDQGRIAEQGAPQGVPPDEGRVGGEHADRDVPEPGGEPLDARGHVGADRSVLGREESGCPVELVAFGAGELEGSGEGADRFLRRPRPRGPVLERVLRSSART